MANYDSRNRRLKIEAKHANKKELSEMGIEYGPLEDSLDTWQAVFEGPKGSVYEGTSIEVKLHIPKNYPFVAPVLKTDIIHPNVFEGNGEVCMSMLHNGKDRTGYEKMEERWNAGKGIVGCVLGFQQMLLNPNLESAANLNVGFQYRDNRALLKERILNSFIKKEQDRAFEKCKKEDEDNEKKKMNNNPEADKRENSGYEAKRKIEESEAAEKSKKKKSGEEKEMWRAELPEEPKSGGVRLKFKTKLGIFNRVFDLNNEVSSAFAFLGSCGIDAVKFTVPVYDGIDKVIHRQNVKKSTFDDLKINKSSCVFVDPDPEADAEAEET